MSLEADLFTYLKTVAPLTALVGTGDNCRIFPQRLPANPTYPSIVFSRVSGPRSAYTHDNAGNPPVGTVMVHPRISFQLWAAKDTDGAYEDLLPVEEALVGALSGFKGLMGSTQVQSCFIDNDADGFEPDSGSNRRTVDAILTHEE